MNNDNDNDNDNDYYYRHLFSSLALVKSPSPDDAHALVNCVVVDAGNGLSPVRRQADIFSRKLQWNLSRNS